MKDRQTLDRRDDSGGISFNEVKNGSNNFIRGFTRETKMGTRGDRRTHQCNFLQSEVQGRDGFRKISKDIVTIIFGFDKHTEYFDHTRLEIRERKEKRE